MGLRLKFNLVLIVVFLTGFAAEGLVSRQLLQDNAREEVLRNARLMMDTALAVRSYTVEQVKPHLDKQLGEVFLPQTAPASMIKIYGDANGFGWKHNEIVDAQVVTVPMEIPIQNADRAFKTFMASLADVFGAVFIALDLMLSWLIVRPIRRHSRSYGNDEQRRMKLTMPPTATNFWSPPRNFLDATVLTLLL